MRFTGITTNLGCVVVLAGTVEAMSDDPAGHLVIASVTRPHVVASLEVGSRADQLADIECGEGECVAGFGMAGPGETVYFYDYGHKNIKVISTDAGAMVAQEVIEGIDLTPDDGTVLPDSTIYLLVDRWESLSHGVERYAIYRRRVQTGRWEELPPPIDKRFGKQPDGINVYDSVLMGSNLQGDVFVYDFRGVYEQIATSEGLLEVEDRRPMTPAAAGLGEMICLPCGQVQLALPNSAPSRPSFEITSIGIDGQGRMYSLMNHRDNEMTIQRHDPSGAVLSAVVLPRVPSEKMFLGKQGPIVLASGRIMCLQVDNSELNVVEIPF